MVRSLYSELLRVLAQHNPTVDASHVLQSDWVEKPGKLFTWLIEGTDGEHEKRPVAMALVCGRDYTEALGGSGDFWMYEFVVAEGVRREGIGRASAELVIESHGGRWCLDVLPGNERAMGFWTEVLARYEPRTARRTDDEDIEFVRFEFGPSVDDGSRAPG